MANNGMRRILKHPPDPIEWIRSKVTHKLYDRKTAKNILSTHEVFTLHPLPTPPLRPGSGISKKDFEIKLPTDPLVENYLKRNERREWERQGGPGGKGEVDEEENRMSAILGIQRNRGLKDKSTILANAYEFAVKQLEVMKLNPELSKKESVRRVEEMLREEDSKERMASRERRSQIEQHVAKSSKTTSKEESTSLPSMLHSKPRTVLQMNAWGERLRGTPYEEWTLGAVTALDHWIATQVLEISEENWERMLRGEAVVGVSRARDVVAVRRALFPETLTDSQRQRQMGMEAEEMEEEDTHRTKAEKSIDELLASLGAAGGGEDEDEDDDVWDFDDDEDEVETEEQKREARLDQLTDELQTWRERNLKGAYETWAQGEQKEFDDWLHDYLAFLSSSAEEKLQIDIPSTRQSLLSSPPTFRSQNQLFWKQISDETEAEIFIHRIRTMPPPSQDHPFHNAYEQFLKLPYQQQLQKLVDIGTLKTLYDEYATERDVSKFWMEYGDVLLHGTELEYLVEDEVEGHVTSDDLGEMGQKKYRMEVKRYGEVEMKEEIEKEVLEAYVDYKALKASHEEKLFKDGKLGLRYGEDKDKEQDRVESEEKD